MDACRNLHQHLDNRPNARALQQAASPLKIRESLPPDLPLRLASCECRTVFDYRMGPHNKLDRPSCKGGAPTEAQNCAEGRDPVPAGRLLLACSPAFGTRVFAILRDRCTILVWL